MKQNVQLDIDIVFQSGALYLFSALSLSKEKVGQQIFMP